MKEIDLEGVPETMLWPLWNRAVEAQRNDRLIDDPWSADLVREIDYDFAGRVGDDLVSDFIGRFGDKACVVALGEGLETQYWRLGEPEVPWLSIDLPEAIEVRARLLPKGRSVSHHSYSALNEEWMNEVPEGHVPLVSAMGLLMYFEEAEVIRLLSAIAERFPSAEVFFDAIPPFFSRKTMSGFNVTKNYRAPQMPWGIAIDEIPGFIGQIPGLQVVSVQSYVEPFPNRTRFYRWLARIPPLRRHFAASLVHLRCES